MLAGYPVGYWCPTYKDLYNVWNELKHTLYPITKSKDEQVKQLTLTTGGQIDMWSLEDPNSGRGRKYKRIIIDEAEKGRHLKDAWEQTIRATLVDYSGDAWFMSTPKFGQTYFKNVLFKNAERFDDWRAWRFTSYDNPYLPASEIDAAKAQLDDLTFKCEFMAEDVDVTLRPFAYAYSDDKHKGIFDRPVISQPLYLSFDFNIDPITCTSYQHSEDRKIIRCHKEFRLRNSDIEELCDAIVVEYGLDNYFIRVTGDASGKNGTAIRKNTNYYTIIQRKLNLPPNRFFLPGANPLIDNSRVLVNSILHRHPNLLIHEDCKYLIEDLKYVEVNENGDIDKTKDVHRGHLLDNFRYYLNAFHSDFIKNI